MRNDTLRTLFYTISTGLALAGTVILIGCYTNVTPLGAAAEVESGTLLGTFILDSQGASSVKGLTDLATALPLMVYGKVTPYQQGQIAAELEPGVVQPTTTNAISAAMAIVSDRATNKVKPNATVIPTSTEQKWLDQLEGAIAVITTSSLVTGPVTAPQSLAAGQVVNTASGITIAVERYQGFNSGTAPVFGTP